MQVTSLVNVPRPIFDSIVFHLSCESIENNFITFRSFVRIQDSSHAISNIVFRNLVKNKLVPDPFYGLGNESIIDIVDSLVDLNFWAIIVLLKSYRNGHKEVLPKGMFRGHLGGVLLISPTFYPPDYPGRISPRGGQVDVVNPDSTYKALITSLSQKKDGRIDAAVKIFQEIIQVGHSFDKEVIEDHIGCFCKLGKFNDARICTESLQKLDFSNPLTYSLYVRSLCRAGRLEQALALISEVHGDEQHILSQYFYGSLVTVSYDKGSQKRHCQESNL
ncbi:hypothetical protein FXO38_24139 [Capsicum annuum]|nr:hypothetical protein FXO38_24139 [Capsicum annuum]